MRWYVGVIVFKLHFPPMHLSHIQLCRDFVFLRNIFIFSSVSANGNHCMIKFREISVGWGCVTKLNTFFFFNLVQISGMEGVENLTVNGYKMVYDTQIIAIKMSICSVRILLSFFFFFVSKIMFPEHFTIFGI